MSAGGGAQWWFAEDRGKLTAERVIEAQGRGQRKVRKHAISRGGGREAIDNRSI